MIALTAILTIGAVAAWQWRSIASAYYSYCLQRSTTGLPRCDRVEVYYLDGETEADSATGFPVRPYGSFSRILEQKTLRGQEAEEFAELWRSQLFGHEYQSLCHYPAFGFRFYRGSTLKFETSVCFNCDNFYVTSLGRSYWHGFASGTQKGDELLNRLQEIFPASIQENK